MRARLSLALTLASSFAFANNAPDGGHLVKDFETCAIASCSSDIVEKFHTDQRSLSGKVVYGEPFYVEQGASSTFRTLFAPTRILRVYNPRTDETLVPSVDYQATATGFEILPTSTLAKAPAGFSTPLSEVDRTRYGARLSQEFQNYQYAVTYEKDQVYTPSSHGSLDRLVGQIGKKPLRVTFFGDSVTEGGDASGVHGLAPYQPGYAELVMAYLNSKAPGMWQSRNNSVGGWLMKQALGAADYRLTDRESDLVVLAFGMNDSVVARPWNYERQLEDVVKTIRAKYPDTAILLVGTTLANPQSPLQKPASVSGFQMVLQRFVDEHDNIAVVDATSTWHMLLEHKSYLDFTGNGFNHPNDFGHRILAESVLSALLGPNY